MMPFTVIGATALKGKYEFSYTPVSLPGMAENPVHQEEVCYGLDLRTYDVEKLRKSRQINLTWMKELYAAYPEKERFFDQATTGKSATSAGSPASAAFKEQIVNNVSEEDIRKSWEPGLSQYKEMRKKYLLYP